MECGPGSRSSGWCPPHRSSPTEDLRGHIFGKGAHVLLQSGGRQDPQAPDLPEHMMIISWGSSDCGSDFGMNVPKARTLTPTVAACGANQSHCCQH
eukprot:1280986-Alexandrium_andersonii.AAC.1